MALLIVFAVAALAMTGGTGSDERSAEVRADLPAETLDVAPAQEPSAQAQPDELAPVEEPSPDEAPPGPAPDETPVEPIPAAAPPEPAPPPSENRASCSAIRGTDYRSLAERDWYGANCGRIASGAAAASLPSGDAARPSGGQSPLGDRLVIPAAGVDTEVWRVSVPASGVMPDPAGYFNALWYDFSSLAGLGGSLESGNLVLSGHVDCGKCYNGGAGTAVFWSVRNLKPGDTAQYRAADGRTANYVVTSSRSLGGSTDGVSLVASEAADMTLITCTGSFSGGEYSLRHVVALRKA